MLPDGYDLTGKIVVATGGTGVLLGPTMAALCKCGAKLALIGTDRQKSASLIDRLLKDGYQAKFFQGDITDLHQIKLVADQIMEAYGGVDILINGAGGNNPQATTSPERPFFELDQSAVWKVMDINFMGAFYCCQVFGKRMADRKSGVILNILSMNAIRPLTRIPAYSASKAALANFTQWLAVHMAQVYSPSIRVNAIAPGFFLTQQNQYLLLDEQSGELTQRGSDILLHTPMSRFGVPEDVVGAILWLVSDASRFVNGVIIPVDGGFSAFSGV